MKSWSDVGVRLPSGAHGEIDVLCPACSHTRQNHPYEKCLSINVEKGVGECKHCGHIINLGDNSRSRDRKMEYGAPLIKQEKEYTRPTPPKPADGQQPLYDYFASRGIPVNVVQRNKIVLGSFFSAAEGKEIPAIMFQYFRGSDLINIKYRALAKKAFQMVSGAERILYGLNDIEGADTIIIVEGEIDKLSLETVGYRNVVSVPDGAPSPNTKQVGSKLDYFNEASEAFDKAKRIVFAVDGDAPGDKLAEFLLGRFKRGKCSRVRWPEGCKDANDVLVKLGEAELVRCINDAEHYPVTGLFDVRTTMPEVWGMYEKGLPRGVTTGWRNLDEVYRPLPGTLTMVTGSPSAGKSHFLDNLVINLARLHDWRFGFYSPENYPLHYHVSRLLSVYYRKPFGHGPTSRLTPEEVEEGMWWLNERFGFIYPSEPTIEEIVERAYAMRSRMGINGLILDPWNEIERSMDGGMNETQYVSKCLSDLRHLARDTDLHIWLVAHPTKLQKGKDDKYPVPTPYDISGSAHFYNKADQCLSVHRDQDSADEPVGVHVQKMRFSQAGQRGVAYFKFDRVAGIYIPVGYRLPNGHEEFYGDHEAE